MKLDEDVINLTKRAVEKTAKSSRLRDRDCSVRVELINEIFEKTSRLVLQNIEKVWNLSSITAN